MRILLTGGSACGKSKFAETVASQLCEPHWYLATMRPYGTESLVKIARHKNMREEMGFFTIERDVDIAGVGSVSGGTILLECMCNLTANELFDEKGSIDENAYERILNGIISLEDRCENLIVVTNDVGSGTAAAYDDKTLLYVEVLGRLNAVLALRFDTVYELVCGIPLCIKGALPKSFERKLL